MDSEVDCSTVRLFAFRCALKLDQQKSFKNVLLAPEHWKTDLIWAELVLIKEQICVFSTCICLNGRTFIICALNCFVIYQTIYQRDKNSRCASCVWHKSPLVLKELDPFGVFYQKHPKFHRRNLSAQFAATCFCVCWFLHSILCRRLDCFSFWPSLDLLGQKLAEHVSLHTVAFRWNDVDSFVFINVVLFPVFASLLSLPSCRGSSSLGGYDRPQIVLEMESACRTMTDSAEALQEHQHLQPALPAAPVTEHHLSGFTRVYLCLSAAATCHQHLLTCNPPRNSCQWCKREKV